VFDDLDDCNGFAAKGEKGYELFEIVNNQLTEKMFILW